MGRRKTGNKIDGWLILDKPEGITSAKAVAMVKHLLKPLKIGHAGTLDPLATGVLPLALGEATKTVPYMMAEEKSYRFTVKWGQARDTDDAQGQVIAESDKRPDKGDVLDVMTHFNGEIEQLPPQYSALKVDGQRAYALARAGQEFELKRRKVMIYSLYLEESSDEDATFTCNCSKGTYIRSIARDMGEILGCYGHITMLRREQVGDFGLEHTILLDSLADLVHNSKPYTLWPVDAALDDILAWDINPDQAELLKSGQFLSLANHTAGDAPIKLRARCGEKLVAICESSQGLVKPVRVFDL